MFTVGLVDQITKPIAKISKQFSGLASNYQAGTMKMATGAAGIASVGYALQKALMPAIELDRKLGELKSLGVHDDALKQVANTSYDFALKYGKSATEFVNSSYNIQSAIGGLTGKELAEFTKQSNILAMATKSDSETITSYMGAMYGIFQNEANSIGKANWVNQISGQTAKAVEMYRTTGAEMTAAFSNLSNTATNVGVSAAEQFAMIGRLQLVAKSGSIAGTQSEKFIQGIGKAQKQLGITLKDQNGDLLSLDTVIGRINGKLSSLGSVDKLEVLTKIFGDQGAKGFNVLSTDIQALTKDTIEFQKITNNGQSLGMAEVQIDQSQRLAQSWYVVRAAFGTAILPAFNEFAGWLADTGRDLVKFTEQHPTLAKYIGYSALALLGLVAAGGLFTLMMGANQMVMTTWGAGVKAAGLIGSGYSTVITGMQARLSGLTFTTMFYTSKLWLKNKALAASNIATTIYGKGVDAAKLALTRFRTTAAFTGGYLPALSAVMRGATVSTWGFVASLTAAAAPIIAIVALVAAVAIGIYKYWQPIKAFFGGFWDGLTEGFAPVGEVFGSLFESLSFLGDIFSWIGEQVGFSSEELKGFADAGKSFGSIMASIFNGLLWPIKQFIKLLTGGINLVKDITGSIANFFGFGGNNEIKSQLTHQQVLDFALPNNVIPMTNNVIPTPLANQNQQVRDLVTRPKNLIELPTARVERTKAQPIFNSSNNNSSDNSNDNSRKMFVENITIQSDDANRDFSKLMELAG
jgi:TP901 family phage tail tape measure protein